VAYTHAVFFTVESQLKNRTSSVITGSFLWLASDKHVTLLINNMERSSVERWSDEKVFMLTDLLKSYECLYDVTHVVQE